MLMKESRMSKPYSGSTAFRNIAENRNSISLRLIEILNHSKRPNVQKLTL